MTDPALLIKLPDILVTVPFLPRDEMRALDGAHHHRMASPHDTRTSTHSPDQAPRAQHLEARPRDIDAAQHEGEAMSCSRFPRQGAPTVTWWCTKAGLLAWRRLAIPSGLGLLSAPAPLHAHRPIRDSDTSPANSLPRPSPATQTKCKMQYGALSPCKHIRRHTPPSSITGGAEDFFVLTCEAEYLPHCRRDTGSEKKSKKTCRAHPCITTNTRSSCTLPEHGEQRA